MTDALTDAETAILGKPIVVNPSSALDLVTMVLRYVGTAGSAFVAIVGYIRGHDLAGLFTYLQGDTVLPALGAVATLGFMAWGGAAVLIARRKLVIVANAAPDAVAVVEGASIKGAES
jgi:hypothetical protein